MLRVINKVSQNLHAEILLRLLGRERGTAGTIEGGLEVLRGFLTQAGISNDQYVFYDGSGLSRQNLVTPHAIVQLLRYSAEQPWGADYKSTFPIAGVDGSLTDRLTSPRLQRSDGEDRLARRRQDSLRLRDHRLRTGRRVFDSLEQLQSAGQTGYGHDRPGGRGDRERRSGCEIERHLEDLFHRSAPWHTNAPFSGNSCGGYFGRAVECGAFRQTLGRFSQAAGYFQSAEVAGSKLRRDANYKTGHANLEQIPLGEVQSHEQFGGDVEMHQSAAHQRDPTNVISESSHQLQTTDVAHGEPPNRVGECTEFSAFVSALNCTPAGLGCKCYHSAPRKVVEVAKCLLPEK